jgi:hypothetical protein
MYATSEQFKATVRGTHRAIVRVEVWRGDQKVLDLQPVSGQVDIDARRGVRRTLSLVTAAPDPTVELARQAQTYSYLAGLAASYDALAAAYTTYSALALTDTQAETLVDVGIVPDDGFDALAPFGNEIRVWRGVEVTTSTPGNYTSLAGLAASYSALAAAYPTYTDLDRAVGNTETTVEELIPLGVFVITDVEVDTGENGTTVTVRGSDRSLRISRARWTDPYTYTRTTVDQAILGILEDRWDDVDTDLTVTDTESHRAVLGLETDNDPWKDCTSIAEAAGMDLFFDGDGVACLIPVRDYETATPDAVYLEDVDAVILALKRALTTEQTYNGCIATGEGSEGDAVYRGEAWDDDATSPTYRYGPFGQVPQFYSSPLITSDDQAASAAAAILARKKGAQETISWIQLVDPSLDAGDLVQVQNTAAKVDKVLVLDRVTIPLDVATPMQAVARTIRVMGSTGIDDGEG